MLETQENQEGEDTTEEIIEEAPAEPIKEWAEAVDDDASFGHGDNENFYLAFKVDHDDRAYEGASPKFQAVIEYEELESLANDFMAHYLGLAAHDARLKKDYLLLREETGGEMSGQDPGIVPTLELVQGLISTSAPTLDHPSKKQKASRYLTSWRKESKCPARWIADLDDGKTIATGDFDKADDDNQYHHRRGLWKSARLILTDADVIRGVDYDKAKLDTHPSGVEPFTDLECLFEIYPSLLDEAFAIGHSISSLSEIKPPPHVRARIAFLTSPLITPETFDDFLTGLAHTYSIISVSRSPVQPVFGNASKRRVFRDGVLVEETSQFESTIYGNVLSWERVEQIIKLGRRAKASKCASKAKQMKTCQPIRSQLNHQSLNPSTHRNLADWLQEHGICIHMIRANAPCYNGTADMYCVTCPWESEHTSGFGVTDTAVYVDPSNGRWCFNCFHAHCDERGWEDYRQAVAPRPIASD